MRQVLILVLLLGGLLPFSAQAYPWMIKHNYVGCQACHVDPSGGGLLTQYGRAQTELLVQSRYKAPSEEGEVSDATRFLYGAFMLPDEVAMEISVRVGGMLQRTATPGSPVNERSIPLQMVTDYRVGYVNEWLRASAAIGVAIRRAAPAAITYVAPGDDGFKLVSREFWAGLNLMDGELLVRAGRMNVPFGLRVPEHTLWVRTATRTDINEDQQYGLAVAYNGATVRGEIMGIAGNYQLGPDLYRERGAAGYAEVTLLPRVAAGVSFLVTAAGGDIDLRLADPVRQSYGLFARYGVNEVLALQAEADFLLFSANEFELNYGATALLQADLELVRGLHLNVTGELLRDPTPNQVGIQRGGWVGFSWFAVQSVELRVDAYVRQVPQLGAPDASSLTAVFQLHLYI